MAEWLVDHARDYYFDKNAQQQGLFAAPSDPFLQIQTISPVSSAKVTVTSRDYGGRDRIRATITVNGIQFPAHVVETGQTYASIPIDTNGNWIADYWEQQLAPGVNIAATDDNEAGPASSLEHGDGFSAHDEYRGFFVYDVPTERLYHVRTNPVANKDVFFWDPNAFVSSRIPNLVYLEYPTSVGLINEILTPQTPFFKWWQVTRDSNWPVNINNLGLGTLPLNLNTSTDNTGYSLNFWIDNNLGAAEGDTSDVVGSASPSNDGLVIALKESSFLQPPPPYTTLSFAATTIAHEAGHKLGLSHPCELRSISTEPPSGTSPSGYYGRDPDGYSLYTWIYYYGSAPWKGTKLVRGSWDLAGVGPWTAVDSPVLVPNLPYLDGTRWLMKYTSDVALPTPSNKIKAAVVRETVMDWDTKKQWSSGGPFSFQTLDLQQMCLRTMCSLVPECQ